MAIPWPDSLWAAVTPPADDFFPLDTDVRCDVVVLGAGFTGLSTALALARDGRDVVIVEAMAPGFGASGRNNGQVIPTLTRPEPDDIEARHGEAGQRFVALLRDSAGITFDLIREHGIEAEAEQSGWVQPVHTPGRMKIAERRVAQWSARGAPVELLSAAQVEAITGSRIWHGGWTNPTGGHLNPLALCRGLARRVKDLGGRIFTQTPATSYRHRQGAWEVNTPRGTVTASALVLATNAYTGEMVPGLAPAIARQVVPVLSWQMATGPLGDNVRRQVIPRRQAVSDTHGELHFARYDARHRLVTGGATMVSANAASRLRVRIGARLQRMFEHLGEVRFDYVWNGYLGMTSDYMPRVHRLGPDGYAWAGCNGRGVALSIAMGREMARAVCGTPVTELAMPLSDPSPLPLHGLVRRLAPLRLLEYRWRDAREI